MTEKLYETDETLTVFSARVTGVQKRGEDFAVALDRTAFFPDGGGQAGDRGTLGSAAVRNTIAEGDAILHLCDAAPAVGDTLSCRVDTAVRFDRMQNHTAEHIVSGIVHRRFGYRNVGFHLGERETTLDLDGFLDRAALDEAEDEANRAVWENLPVTVTYPSPDELARMEYRAKKELTGRVRIVTIPGYDCCACCAPHVARTGEIGAIKLLDAIRYKGGVRILLVAGARALRDYREKYREVATVSRLLSLPQDTCGEGVSRLLADLSAGKQERAALRRALCDARLATAVPNEGGNLLFFCDLCDEDVARHMALAGSTRTPGVSVVVWEAGNTLRFVMAGKNLRAKLPGLRAALACRGGGGDDLLQGTFGADRAAIARYFAAPLG